MADEIRIIRVPKTPKSAFNRERRPSALLHEQLSQVEASLAESGLAAPRARRGAAATEGELASRLKRAMDQMFAAGTPKPRGHAEDIGVAREAEAVVEVPARPKPTRKRARPRKAVRKAARKQKAVRKQKAARKPARATKPAGKTKPARKAARKTKTTRRTSSRGRR